MEKTEFVYKAFISYTARDTQFVNKLEEWLIRLSEHADADRKYKFFRDSSYSNVGESVEESLKQRLKESEWLILVCSPYINDYKETEKNWVDFECSYYAYTLGRADNIVCIVSNTAPPDRRDISLFYPESIKDLCGKLAADMRGSKEWNEEISRIYARITNRPFTDIYNITNAFYWKKQYYDIIAIAYKKLQQGNNRDALRIMSEIPDNYNPCRIEWNYLKALCSKSAYNDYCGYLSKPAGNKVICFDRKSSYAYSTDNKYFYVINCLSTEVESAIPAHDGNVFRFFYLEEGRICTFDDQITVKLWKYDGGKVILVRQAAVKIQFSKSEPAVFKSFYPDCQLNHIPIAYHHQARLLALTARHNLFLLNMETMEYKTMDIPPLKKTIPQLSCVWKNLVFSENAEMLFLTDDRYLLGWDFDTENYAFLWNRKWPQPHHTFHSESNIYNTENTTYSIHIYDNGQKAEWKENNNTILFFNPISYKKLDSVYAADQGNDYIILLYEDNTVQVLKRHAGVVYSENVSVEKLDTGSDFPETYCPAVIWQGELWHMTSRQMCRPFYAESTNHPSVKMVSYHGITAADSNGRRSISIYNADGQPLAEKEICIKKQSKLLTDEEMNLSPGRPASELLRKYVSQSLNPEIYECSTYDFIDERNILIGCTKGYLYLWEIEYDILTEIPTIHKKDITSLQIYRQWDAIITADSEGMVAIWQYRKENERISIGYASSFHTHNTNIMVQLMSENKAAVFCNDTGELKLYTKLNEKNKSTQTLLSAEAAKAENIYHVLSIYVTADLSRLVVCRQNQIDFIRLPDGNVVLESEMHDRLNDLKICDDEKIIELTFKDLSGYDYKETYYIANLANQEYNKLLQDRRLHFFSANNYQKLTD